jgi:hypothetical protein
MIININNTKAKKICQEKKEGFNMEKLNRSGLVGRFVTDVEMDRHKDLSQHE